MNYPNIEQHSYSATKKPFPIALVILGVVALLVVLAVVGGIRAFDSVSKDSSEAVVVGNRFIDSMGKHRYQMAQSMFTPQVQVRTYANTLRDIETLMEKHHGTYINHGLPQWNFREWNGQTSVRLVYPVKFTKSICTVSIVLVRTGKGYQVYDTHYDF